MTGPKRRAGAGRSAIAAMMLTVLAVPASAQEKAVVADCGQGGCTCHLSAVTPEEASIVYGIDPPASGDMTLVITDGEAQWSATPRGDIDLVMGGDGQCELALFPEIVPEDGQWTGRVVAESVQGCPAAMEPTLRQMAATMVFTRRIDWGGEFHPDSLRDPAYPSAVNWTRLSATEFSGVGKAEQTTGPMQIRLRYSARLTAPDRVVAGLRVTVGAKAGDATANAILAQAGLRDCRVVARYDFTRTGG